MSNKNKNNTNKYATWTNKRSSPSGRRLRVEPATPMETFSPDRFSNQYTPVQETFTIDIFANQPATAIGTHSTESYTTIPESKPVQNYDARLSYWTIAQIGLRIASLVLVGILNGMSIRGYVSSLLVWLALSLTTTIWEISELAVFAKHRTHGIKPMIRFIMELILTFGSLGYVALAIVQLVDISNVTNYTWRYGSVEYGFALGLCACLAIIHAILCTRAFKDCAAMKKLGAHYAV
ncbi:uncharacterized protein BCR38DRAFT_2922 [Pseudomassariella vexata]|uniref:Uncharacterized protein n=1 Tax=Pseudomassariella vexata TaxID=1141098 RepID=A0A1Y2EHY3_9PEZI|nr:uncharacterized protein BCR38DRAFT_2922 [Pseudomassariella vexata]ORY71047.1 hypothetical protein BCR38DRAFT_2922 [Pseudomassariella vexata]